MGYLISNFMSNFHTPSAYVLLFFLTYYAICFVVVYVFHTFTKYLYMILYVKISNSAFGWVFDSFFVNIMCATNEYYLLQAISMQYCVLSDFIVLCCIILNNMTKL